MPRPRPIAPVASRLVPFDHRGANPGGLDAFIHVPDTLRRHPALVVVLHGCTQTAAGYDHGAGWSALADRHGFILLFPQQRRANNANGCFNWFEPGDVVRGGGEAASIAAMTGAVAATHAVDAARIFVTGLSAGGAMTAAMLAAYPELFAAGAIIAGLPHGAASGVGDALAAMARPRPVDPAALGDAVRGASRHAGPWPRVAVWHGDADRTVAARNGDAVAAQWCDIHGLTGSGQAWHVDGHRVRRWPDAEGRVQVEAWTIAGLGHGTPVTAAADGAPGPFFLEAGIASSAHIAHFFGIAPLPAAVSRPAAARPAPPSSPAPPPRPAAARAAGAIPPRPAARPKPAVPGVEAIGGRIAATINEALRAAGLIKR